MQKRAEKGASSASRCWLRNRKSNCIATPPAARAPPPLFTPRSDFPPLALEQPTVIEMPLFAGTAAEVRRGNATTAADGSAQGSSSPRPPRPRSEASRILEGLCDIWDTWLPPKAVDSFRRGESRGGGPDLHGEKGTEGGK